MDKDTLIKILKIILFILLAPIMVLGMLLSIYVPKWLELLDI